MTDALNLRIQKFGSGSRVRICNPAIGGLEGSTLSQSVMLQLPPGGHVHPNTSHTRDVNPREDRGCEVTRVGSATALDGRHGTSNVLFTEELFLQCHGQELALTPFPLQRWSPHLPVLLRQRNCWLADEQ